MSKHMMPQRSKECMNFKKNAHKFQGRMVRWTKLLVCWYHLPLKKDHPGIVAGDLDGPLEQYGPFSQ